MNVNHRSPARHGIGDDITGAAKSGSGQTVPDGDHYIARFDEPVAERHVCKVGSFHERQAAEQRQVQALVGRYIRR